MQALSAERSVSEPLASPATVAVVGGGIAGLIAARELANIDGIRPVIYEADERLGGKILTETVAGVTVEAGPDSFLARDESFVTLCRELGLGDELIEPAVFGARVWTKGRLEPLPSPSVYGMPTTPQAALGCTALSARARVRAAAERTLPGITVDEDVSVGSFVRSRYGREVLERLVDPLLAGTRAGDVDDMSFTAALPTVKAMVDAHGSVMRGWAGSPEASGPPRFIGLRTGMRGVVENLRRAIQGVEVRMGARVDAVTPKDDYFEIVTSGSRIATADAVLVCAPAYTAGSMIGSSLPDVAELLGRITYASAASVALVYPPNSVPVPTDASGILVPSMEETTISGCTFFSAKWPQIAPSDGRQVVRCFVGRAGWPPILDEDDETIAHAAHKDVVAMTEANMPFVAAKVTRLNRSMPQYAVGHDRLVSSISARLEDHPRLGLAGAAYRGSGLPDVAASARFAAARLVKALH